MSIAAKLLATSGTVTGKMYVDDVFSTSLYAGTGASQPIVNGLDLANNGGLVWTKSRSSANGALSSHFLSDSARGTANLLSTDSTNAQNVNGGALGGAFTANGFNSIAYGSEDTGIVSWAFRRAPKFFDVVTYVGNGLGDQKIPHSLGAAPGMVIIKATSAVITNWVVQHASLLAERKYLLLNTIAAGVATASTPTAISWSDSSAIWVHSAWPTGNGNDLNKVGVTYVAYLFAHDPSADGLIQCRSFTGNGATQQINLGFEPQLILMKMTSSGSPWYIWDTSRGMAMDNATRLLVNTANSESVGNDDVNPTAVGFTVKLPGFIANGTNVIYMAIRRPNKPPTSGGQVYNAIARTGTGADVAAVTGVGFAPDLLLTTTRNNGSGTWFIDKLRSPKLCLKTSATGLENLGKNEVLSFDLNGVTLGNSTSVTATNWNTYPYIYHFFRRALGFIDVVCWTGNSTNARQVPHSLGVQPELIIHKSRNAEGNWVVSVLGVEAATSSPNLKLNTNDFASANYGASCKYSTNTSFYVDFNTGNLNANSINYVSYLFASLPGISKVFKYTGNGGSQTINCGFSNGARFILIKRTSNSPGNWYIWDTARGIVAGSDPHISPNLNTTAEVTTNDSIDPEASGFIVNQVAPTNININSETYIGLAIA